MTTVVAAPSSVPSASPRRPHKGRRVSAIRVWSDTGDSGLELLVVEHASEEQQIALKLSSLRTALEHCRQNISRVNSSPTSVTLSETSVRLRGVLSELNNIDKTLSNKGISYASEEQTGPITESDLPPLINDSPPNSPNKPANSSAKMTKPSHRQVSAMRNYAQDLLVKCVEEKEVVDGTTRKKSLNNENKALSVDIDNENDSPRSSIDNNKLASPMDEDKPIIGEAVAAALAQTGDRNQTQDLTPKNNNNSESASITPVNVTNIMANNNGTSNSVTIPISTPSSSTTTTTAQSSASTTSSSTTAAPRGKTSMMNYTISRWGEVIKEPRAPPTAAELKKHEQNLVRDEERELKWIKMIKDFNKYEKSKPEKVKRRIRKGIPDSMRGIVWPRLTGAIDAMKNAKPGTYRTELAKDCELSDVIGRDIARTFPHHLLFRDEFGLSGGDGEEKQGSSSGRQSLYNVLKAYANYDKQVGYCQGMGFIVGLFLMYLSEEESFWMLERVMRGEKYNMFALYAIGFPLLHQWFYQLEQLIAKFQPKLFDHLQMHGITPTLYATQWFFTVFANNMPFELVLRIWDCFLSEGPKVAFRFSLSLLNHFAPAIIEEDFEGSITVLKDMHNDPYVQDTDRVVEEAMTLKLKSAELRSLAHEYDQQQVHNRMAARRKGNK